ncbi:hypothetical protein AYO44_04585 [Planctomycetaceae bacterium SCGC AG-212-F19]|nr:hypothetical protein AYO44_04585 [Planctomycetaceae bacterium SCGC AG-212-F19]
MTTSSPTAPAIRLVLAAETAADLMTPNPLSVREGATLTEAVAFLTDKGISAAPVIDPAGRPVGVLSRADIVVHDREEPDRTPGTRATSALVRDVMTPAVFSVTPETSATRVVEDLLNLRVHRLFVVDRAGVLVGIISVVDVLRFLRRESVIRHSN